MKMRQSAYRLALASSLVVASFSSTGLQVVALSAGGLVVLAGEAMAQTGVPGIGTVVKKKPGNASIIRGVSGDDGKASFRGLEAGNYDITVGTNKPISFVVPKGAKGIVIIVTGNKSKYVGHVTLLR